MKKVVVALSVLAMAAFAAPTASAASTVPTQPTASQTTVYPYVQEGRVDETAINYGMEDPLVTSYELQVYKAGTVWFSEAFRLYRADIGHTGTTQWNPRTMGDVLSGDTTGQDGRSFMVCVYPAAQHLEDTDVFADWCIDVFVVHYVSDRDVTKRAWGSSFYAEQGDCRTVRQHRPVLIKCDPTSTVRLRYELTKPGLPAEQRVLVANMNWKGRAFRMGDGISLNKTPVGGMVVASEKFWGKVRWISKTWTIRTEF